MIKRARGLTATNHLRILVVLATLMALAMITRPAFADETYSLGWAEGINPSDIKVDGKTAGTISAMIQSAQQGSVDQIPRNDAIPGKVVFVTALAEDGYVPKRLYYQSGGNETEIAFGYENNRYEGTFVMPAADTVIGAEFTKKTYTVSVDFGSNHAEFVQQHFAGKNSISITAGDNTTVKLDVEGSVVKLTVPHEEVTLQGVAIALAQSIGSSTDYVDNNECLMTNYSELLLGTYPRSGYYDEAAYNKLRPDEGRIITQNMNLYALWAPPVGPFTLTLKPCECGDVLTYKNLSRAYWDPHPYNKLDGNVRLYDYYILYSRWEMEKPEGSNNITLQGGTSYPAVIYIAPNWGYFFPDNFADSMTLVNGELAEPAMGSWYYQELKVSIPAKHVAPEGTKKLAPTCTKGDSRTYSCSKCNQYVEETAEALGHDWNEPTYTWADDNSTCTATRSCKRDASHVETETVKSTAAATASCTKGGATTYTATFENEAFKTQTKNVEFASLGHDWGEWKQTKAPTCTEKGTEERVCKRDSSHTETREVTVDSSTHDWGEPTYGWSDDNSICIATRSCKRDASHVETEVVQTTSAVTKEPTATEAGTRTYTATFGNTAFAAQTRTVEIPATGGDGAAYAVVEVANVTWTKGSGVDATVTVKRTGNDGATSSQFAGIAMDGDGVAADQYRAASSDIVVTLPAAYLETLPVGEHDLTISFGDGSVVTRLTVMAAEAPTPAEPGTDPAKPDSNPTNPDGTGTNAGADSNADTDSNAGAGSNSGTGAKANASPSAGATKATLPTTGDEGGAPLAAAIAGVTTLCLVAARRVRKSA